MQFQSTPPTRGATPTDCNTDRYDRISIHAPHAGSDFFNRCHGFDNADFNPRPPRGERPVCLGSYQYNFRFQSTPPTRGATQSAGSRYYPETISIHAPHAGSDPALSGYDVSIRAISIHAPHAGSDHRQKVTFRLVRYFNPRPPRGERRRRTCRTVAVDVISIHAPHAGSDLATMIGAVIEKDFNPRPPRGERLGMQNTWNRAYLFQSTPPTRGATRRILYYVRL